MAHTHYPTLTCPYCYRYFSSTFFVSSDRKQKDIANKACECEKKCVWAIRNGTKKEYYRLIGKYKKSEMN